MAEMNSVLRGGVVVVWGAHLSGMGGRGEGCSGGCASEHVSG